MTLEIVAWTFGAGAVVTAVVWTITWIVLEHSLRAVPRLGQSLAAADPLKGGVCVIAPAHNESRVIAEFVRSLRAETY